MPKLDSVTRTPNGRKAFKAVFTTDAGRKKTVNFGTSSNFVLNKSKTEQDKRAYIARHRVNERFDSPMTAGALSRHILWGASRSWRTNVATFKRRYNL